MRKFFGFNFMAVVQFIAFCILAIENGGALSLGTCKTGEFRCQSSGFCISKKLVCDGKRDCDDGLDENDLICSPKYRQTLCGAGRYYSKKIFRCQFTGCIPLSRVCDGSVNCLDGSDESEICAANSCLPGQFRCAYGACIDDSYMCNGGVQCPDGSDETEEVCRNNQCDSPNLFRCRYGGCIDVKKICDGWKNCADGSDESPELCLITHAKRLSSWLSTSNYDESDYDEVNQKLTEKRRPPPIGDSLYNLIASSKEPTITTTLPSTTTRRTTTETPPPKKINYTAIDATFGATKKVCTLPEIPENAEAIINACRSNPDAYYCNANANTVPFGITVDYQCYPGNSLNGPPTIACMKSGVWSSEPPTCHAIIDVRYGLGSLISNDFTSRCPPLSPSRGVKVECIDPKTLEIVSCSERQKPGVDARFTCSNYYRPAGDLPMHYEKCGEDGKWSPGVQSQFSCVPDCGLSEGSKTPYVINGVASKRGMWPWHVGIYVWVKDELKYICGGALISEFAVLTGAHCVTQAGHLRNASSLVVFLGKQKIDIQDEDPFVQKRKISKIIVEESFNHLILDSDIAILALDYPAVLSFYVRPACYPQASNSFLEEYQLAQGNMGTVLGWGINENGSLSTELRQAQLPVVSAQDCAESHPEFFSSMTRSTTFCAGYRNGTAVCNGDSGGGMYFRAVSRGQSRWYIQGLVSYGVPHEEEGSKRKCASTHYAVFTRVGRYGDWLVKTLSRENLF